MHPLLPQERDEAEAAARRVEEEHESRAPPGREVDEEGHPVLTQEEVEAFVTLKAAWGHTWEEEQRTRAPQEYCAKGEVQLGLKIFYLVSGGQPCPASFQKHSSPHSTLPPPQIVSLGGVPTDADCIHLVRRAQGVKLWAEIPPLLKTTRELRHPIHM